MQYLRVGYICTHRLDIGLRMVFMDSPFKLNKSHLLIGIAGLLLLFYSFVRAGILSITHDEALVYLMTLNSSFSEIVFYTILPQDHMLNTLSMKVLSDMFVPSEFVLRLPNLAGHVLFVVFSFLILKKSIRKQILPAAFILLNFNPYLLDFFSMARGYGLSTGFMTASIYYLLEFTKKDKLKFLISSCLFGILSTLTVVTLLFYFAALVAFLVLFLMIGLIQKRGSKRIVIKYVTALSVVILSTVLLYLILNEPISNFKDNSFAQQNYTTNFFNRTVKTMVDSTFYNNIGKTGIAIISYAIAFSFLVATIIHLRRLYRLKLDYIKSPDFILYFIAISIVISTTIMHHFMGMRFLDNRFTVFLIPLALFTPIYLLNEQLVNIRNWFRISSTLSYLLAIVFIINTSYAANFKYYLEWKYDADTRLMMKTLSQVELKPDSQKSLGIYWLYEPSVNYYKEVNELDWLKKANRWGFESVKYDYYFVRFEDTTSSVLTDCDIVRKYPVSESVLFRRRPLSKHSE